LATSRSGRISIELLLRADEMVTFIPAPPPFPDVDVPVPELVCDQIGSEKNNTRRVIFVLIAFLDLINFFL
jgi:hypothetical protein